MLDSEADRKWMFCFRPKNKRGRKTQYL